MSLSSLSLSKGAPNCEKRVTRLGLVLPFHRQAEGCRWVSPAQGQLGQLKISRGTARYSVMPLLESTRAEIASSTAAPSPSRRTRAEGPTRPSIQPRSAKSIRKAMVPPVEIVSSPASSQARGEQNRLRGVDPAERAEREQRFVLQPHTIRPAADRGDVFETDRTGGERGLRDPTAPASGPRRPTDRLHRSGLIRSCGSAGC